MKIRFFPTLRNYHKIYLKQDIISGLVTAAMSVPVYMGYAQIAGLPAVYGLYGAVIPLLFFVLFSTSESFVFGVDAAPAALMGAALGGFGIVSGSSDAMRIIPVVTFFVGLWLLLFFVLKAGNVVKYISAPVMGGFITGICFTIILMQLPRLIGADAGVGEFFELIPHLADAFGSISFPSLFIGCFSLAVLFVFRFFCPKFPIAIVLMLIGGICCACLPAEELGIKTIGTVSGGLPDFVFPALGEVPFRKIFILSLSIAVVIMAESLLAENNFAVKNGYKIDKNQEILALSLANISASLFGCCAINGSVSCTAMSEQYKGKSQLVTLVESIMVLLALLFATNFIAFLPVPVLTAIVISALIGASEFSLAVKLFKSSKKEFLIFLGAFFGVLVFGTINGVIIGVILSFVEMIYRSSRPVTCFLGIQPGHRHFRDLNEGPNIHSVEGVIIYRFTGMLFFANAEILKDEIEAALNDDITGVIIDAGAVSGIDVTAADILAELYGSLKKRNIRLYITEHVSDINKQLKNLGLEFLIEEGAVRRTIHIALKDMGINRPYPLVGAENKLVSKSRKRIDNKIMEYSWAFGEDAEKIIEKQIHNQIELVGKTGDIDSLMKNGWNYIGELDEDEWLEHLEEHIKEIVRVSGKDEETLAKMIEHQRKAVSERLLDRHPDLYGKYNERRAVLDRHLKEINPEVFKVIEKIREEG